MSSSIPTGPYKLVSVNTSTPRATMMIDKIANDVKDNYTILHSGNAENIESVAGLLSEHQPNLLFCASMWTPEESQRIKKIARANDPSIRIYVVPQGLVAREGIEATMEHVKSRLPEIINGDLGLQ